MHLPLHCPGHCQHLQPAHHHPFQHPLPVCHQKSPTIDGIPPTDPWQNIRLGPDLCRSPPPSPHLSDFRKIRCLHPTFHDKLHARGHVRADELDPMAQSDTEDHEFGRRSCSAHSSSYMLSHRWTERARLRREQDSRRTRRRADDCLVVIST